MKILTGVCICLVAAACGMVNRNPVCTEASLRNTTTQDTLRFFALGDWGRNGAHKQKKLANAMEQSAAEKRIDFVISLGDNFYPDGVSSMNDKQWQKSFEKIYTGPNLKSIPWYAALGNHDYLSDPTAEIAYSKKCSRWFMPDYFYTVIMPMKTGSVRLVVIDTNPFEKRSYKNPKFDGKFVIDSTQQKHWMDSVLSLNDTDWTIVSGHHPLYTGGRRVNEKNWVRASLLPLFNKHNVRIYFSGHEHDLQHLVLPDSLHQFISGAGSELRPTGSMEFTRFAQSVNGFISVELTRDFMDIHIINYKRDTLYQTRIIR